MTYYNEIDPHAAAWLRELIQVGLIPNGDVDERSILEVKPHELTNYTQLHFFAGIGGWSYALRLAGWPEYAEVWTGSCPCQPISCAGKRKGHADERHLWPAFYALIAERNPATIFGEQVAGADGREWLAGVRADLEGLGYAIGCADLCAASVGAPHIRQRLFWVAESRSQHARRELCGPEQGSCKIEERAPNQLGGSSGISGMVFSNGARRNEGQSPAEAARHGNSTESASGASGMGDAASGGCGERRDEALAGSGRHLERSGWSRFEVIRCRDGKARRFEPGSQCVVDGLPTKLADRWNESLRQIEKEINTYASSTKTRPNQTLRALQEATHPQFLQWCAGGFICFQAEAVLFTALCELEGQLGIVIHGETPRVAEALQAGVRRMRFNEEPPCASPGFQLPEQLTRKLTDTVRQMSQEIAHAITHAYPLAHGVSGRVGLLRGYGNAIVPEQAAEFIQASVEALSLTSDLLLLQ